MKVCFAASELSPFASTGGLADVAHALPMALRASGAEIFRVMPYYRHVAESGTAITDTGLRIDIPIGLKTFTAEVFATEKDEPGTYFIRRDEFFDRTELYGLSYRDYDDNFERFVFFQKSVVELIDTLGLAPDIVHCNDWQTGLIPLFLTHGIRGMGRVGYEKTVFTIHNLAYQGLFPGSLFSLIHLPYSCFTPDVLEFYNQVNCIKAGITTADMITTVSRTYAREIQTEELGCGLHGVLRKQTDHLHGIPNGVDYTIWDPFSDTHIKRGYQQNDLRGKQACKRDLAEIMNIEIKSGRPLIGMITRLSEQKGLDILSGAIEQLMGLNLSIVLLGTGEETYHEFAREWQKKWPGRFSARLAYDNELAHKIEAGADMFLMPSRFEPCGLNQLYSLRYGTPPIVHATGGLADTIANTTPTGHKGNGFVFDEYTPHALLAAVKSALKLYNNRSGWLSLVRRGMGEDHSWKASAGEYLDLYSDLIS